MMNCKIMITNIYYCNKDDKDYTRVNFILCGKEKYVDNDTFKGFSEIVSFYPGRKVFDLIAEGNIGKMIDASFIEKTVRGKGLTTSWVLSSINSNGTTIDLL